MKLSQAMPLDIKEPLRSVLTEIVRKAQGVQVETRLSVPTVATLEEGERVDYWDGTNLWQYRKYKGKLYKMAWTGV